MTSTARRPSSSPAPRLSRIVDEALQSVLSPERSDEIVSEALGAAALPTVPDEPGALRVFVEGPLFACLARHLEVSDALELTGQLRGALELAFGAPPSRTRSDVRRRPTLPAEPSRVLVATRASHLVFRLHELLEERVEVLPLDDEARLRERVERVARGAVLIVDRERPGVPAELASLLAAALPPGVTVVWWRASDAERRAVAAELAGGPRFVGCAPERALGELAAVCRDALALD
jgi:hypothetical protein